MVDVTALAALLTPALPFLTRAGERLSAEAAQVLGRHGWDHAQRIWERLAGPVAARPAAVEAADDVAADVQDGEAHVALVRQLRKILESDPALAEEVEELLGDARQAGVVASGARSVAVGGNVSDSAIVTGDNSSIDRR
ncbi:MAG: hypothetical protein QOD24_2852 [Solirubrobacteraceae bacterium]|jgi:hypothetical protein|nr:hypothetical protein [Solirubrobacteraceae bacterium]